MKRFLSLLISLALTLGISSAAIAEKNPSLETNTSSMISSGEKAKKVKKAKKKYKKKAKKKAAKKKAKKKAKKAKKKAKK